MKFRERVGFRKTKRAEISALFCGYAFGDSPSGLEGFSSIILASWYMAAFFRQVKIGVLTLTLEKKQ